MKFGFALSGGGARGIAHLGMIKALEEINLRPSIISGTSAGALIGAFYSYGYRPEEILQIIIETKLFKILKPVFRNNGLVTLEKSFEYFLKFFPGDSFEALKIPFYAAAVNLKSGKTSYFSEGELIRAILASAAIPVIFNPVQIGNELYIDGGILNNLPVDPLIGRCDRIVGFHCNPIDDQYTQNNLRSLMERIFILTTNANVASHRQQCDYYFEPPELIKYRVFDFAKARELFEIGYKHVKLEVPGIREKIIS